MAGTTPVSRVMEKAMVGRRNMRVMDDNVGEIATDLITAGD
jgi:hypothetical protein